MVSRAARGSCDDVRGVFVFYFCRGHGANGVHGFLGLGLERRGTAFRAGISRTGNEFRGAFAPEKSVQSAFTHERGTAEHSFCICVSGYTRNDLTVFYDNRKKDGGRGRMRFGNRHRDGAVFNKICVYVDISDGEFRCLAALYRVSPRAGLSSLVFVAVFWCYYRGFPDLFFNNAKEIRLLYE